MCFSAEASITAGVLLSFVGTETLRKVHKPSQIVFAGIPLFFASQQFTEGVVWLTIPHQEYAVLQAMATYVFLAMAQVIWPMMVPISVLLMEHNKIRKRILVAFLAMGTVVALYYVYGLVFYHAHAEISFMHIAYQSTFKNSYSTIPVGLYLVATILPLFISSVKRTSVLGVIIGLSFVVSLVFYMKCLTSVWCFFAAVVSFVIFYIIRDAHKKFHFKKLTPVLEY
ncbi:MAG: DUF6629 family protein [Fibrobacterota bacterium]